MKVDMEQYKELWKKLGKNKFLLAALIIGVALLLFSGRGGGKTTKEQPAQSKATEMFSVSEQEERLSEILTQVENAGNVKVMLTLRTGAEQVLAQDENTSEEIETDDGKNTQRQEKIVENVIVSADNEESVVALKWIYPEYMGALVVAEGADDPTVKLKLTEAVASLTGLGADKITVIKMKVS